MDAIRDRRFYDSDARGPRLKQVLPLLSQIAAGCSYIHAKNIIHGDLKPDNVLLKTPLQGGSATNQAQLVAKVRLAPVKTHLA